MKANTLKLMIFLICIMVLCACYDNKASNSQNTASKNAASKETTNTAAKDDSMLATKQAVDYVWPWLDSANSRWFYFNTATRPFGMVNLSPDTEINGTWGSGYRYNNTNIKGFNHVHAWQLSGPSVMPVTSSLSLDKLHNDYNSDFNRDNERVKAGYHKVSLERYKIDVELTSTMRVGFHKYQFAQSDNRKILIDLQGKFGPSELIKGEFSQLGEKQFNGYVINQATLRRPRPTPIFFHIETDTVVEKVETNGGEILLYLAPSNKAVLMKVALSYVDTKGAQNNMQKELAHWDFEKTVQQSRDEWNKWLSKIQVYGGTEKQRSRFYTDLFHALQGRRTISDIDGRYSDQTQPERKIKQIPLNENGQAQFAHHNSDSFWGAQWTIQTLWPMAYPKTASDFTQSMLMMYKDGGFVPRGPSGGNYTHVMTGASSTPFIVSAYMKGIAKFDAEFAYKAVKKNHMLGGTMGRAGYEHDSAYSGGLEYYLDLGYVAYPLVPKNGAFHQDGAGQTLEYAFQDFSLAQFAKALGKTEDAKYFSERSQNYRNIFDPETGFMRPKDAQGKWKDDFDPYQYQNGFVESNSSQMTWFVPHDYDGLAELMGGKDVAAKRLNTAFEMASKQGFTSGKSHDVEKTEENRRIPINYGNQPSIQTAFIFNELGFPHLTQYWSREVVNTVYSDLNQKYGFSGDEDQGLMGSLSVLMKIGLFQLDGGTTQNPIYQIGSPIFDRIVISLDPAYYSGKEFVINVENNSNKNRYIQSVTLNGEALNRFYISHDELSSGGVLQLEMGPSPRILGE